MGDKCARDAAGLDQRARQESTKGEIAKYAEMIGHEIKPIAAVENNSAVRRC